MANLEYFTGSDLRLIHPLVINYQEESNRHKKLFIIHKINKELIRVRKSLEEQEVN